MPLFLERVDVKHGGRIPLSAGAVSIGRSPGNTIALPAGDSGASAYHAVIYADPQRALLQDLQSTNGTYVNGRRVQECALSAGDEIGLGRSGPRFRITNGDDDGINDAKGINSINNINGINAINGANAINNINNINGINGINSINSINGINHINNIDGDDRVNNADGIDNANGVNNINNINFNDDDGIGGIGSINNSGINDTDFAAPDAGAGSAGIALPPPGVGKRAPFGRPAAVVAAAVGLFAALVIILLAAALTPSPPANAPGAKSPAGNRDFFSSPAAAPPDASPGRGHAESGEPAPAKTAAAFRINAVLSRFGEDGYRAPPEMVERVEHYLNLYRGEMRRTVALWMDRGRRYFPMIRAYFSEKNVPIELAYVSMLESGFNAEAVSPAGAVGLWQFMPHTARRYGLRVGGGVDERTDPEKSTRAAAAYFKDLIAIFGSRSSVLLCMAAYNAGEQRVINALKRIDDPVRDRDFWYLYRMGWLADETNEYIPRAIALIIVSDAPEEYGFGGGL